MAFIYLFVVAYSVSWGPLQWIYIGEIFPTRIRDYGMAIGAANIWLWNCKCTVQEVLQFSEESSCHVSARKATDYLIPVVVSKISPISIASIGWKTWTVSEP